MDLKRRQSLRDLWAIIRDLTSVSLNFLEERGKGMRLQISTQRNNVSRVPECGKKMRTRRLKTLGELQVDKLKEIHTKKRNSQSFTEKGQRKSL